MPMAVLALDITTVDNTSGMNKCLCFAGLNHARPSVESSVDQTLVLAHGGISHLNLPMFPP
jgi:hypothetical protein